MSAHDTAPVPVPSETFLSGSASGESAGSPVRETWLHAGVTSLILLLGALEGWFKRTDFTTDAISYLDIGRAIPARDWKMVFNPLWSVGYPLLLATARPLFPSTETGEWISIHAVNFAVFIGAWFAFLFLLRSFDPVYKLQSAAEADSRRRFVFITGSCIFVSVQLCIDAVSRVGPDLLVTTLFFLAIGLILRLLAAPSYRRAALLGLVLGLGYWTKGIFLALALTLLLVAAVALISKKRSFAPVILSLAIFVMMVVPYAAGLSWSYGHYTLGEAGPLNYAFHVNYLPRWTNWQGEPGGYGTPLHPTHELMKDPNLYSFGEPYHNTYPPFGNVVYWYQGYRHFWNAKYQVIGISRDLKYLVEAITPEPIFYAVLLAAILMLVTVKDRKEWFRSIARAWPFYLPAGIGIALYVQVHLEDRYLGWFFTIASLVPFVTIVALRNMPSRRIQAWVIGVLAAGAVLNYAIVDRDVLSHIRNHYTYAQNQQWKLGLALERAGLKPGDEMAAIGGPNASCTWAYIAHLRIVAELGGEPYDQHHPVPNNTDPTVSRFWHASPAMQQKIISLFQQTGAVALIASQKPQDVNPPQGWQLLEGTDTWLYRLR